MIAKIDILALNRHEAGALVPWLAGPAGDGGPSLDQRPGEQWPDLARRGFAAGGFELSLGGFFAGLTKLGPKWVVVTDGCDGAYVSAGEGFSHCPAPHVHVVGTAGAGDAFNSTFAAHIASSSPAEEVVLAAATNAASVISHLDTQTGLLGRTELQARIAEQREKLKLRHGKTVM